VFSERIDACGWTGDCLLPAQAQKDLAYAKYVKMLGTVNTENPTNFLL
jgi:hypothetical protein